jgi:16S rRNA processing protein RimM
MVVEADKASIQSIVPSSLIYIGPEKTPETVRSVRPHRGRFIVRIEGCEDRDTAERWRDAEVFLSFGDAEPLGEHEYYHWQIIGLTVQTEEGARLGRLEQIIETGANDVYLVRADTGKEMLLPAIESVIREVDLEGERIIVHLLPGLLPD